MGNTEVPYTAKSLSEAAGDVSFSWIARLCKTGKIDAVKVGTQWYISFDVGQAWLEDRAARKAAKADPEP